VSAALQRRSLRARAPELARVCRRVLVVLLFGILPASLLLAILVGSFRSGTGAWAIDFDGNFLRPAHEILRGVSPYHPAELVHVRHAVAAGHRPDEFHDGVFPAYPAPALLLGVPFSYLPLGLAEWIWAACMLFAGGLALHLVGVRDWRVYGIALLTPAAMSSVLLGAVDFALMLGIAACWRCAITPGAPAWRSERSWRSSSWPRRSWPGCSSPGAGAPPRPPVPSRWDCGSQAGR